MLTIKNGLVYKKDKKFINEDVHIESGTIRNRLRKTNEVIDASGCYVLPGFIDIHTHGANGFDTMNSDYDGFEAMSGFYASKGVTGFLPTTVTSPIVKIIKSLENVRNAMKIGVSGASILGVNLEGPFISRKYKGAHPEEYIVNPSVELMECFIEKSGDSIRLTTIAPEIDGMRDILRLCDKKRIVCAVGHSAMNYADGMIAFSNGFSHVTHLFNAMMGIHHREPGLAGAALDSEKATVEIIADGIHINPAVLRMVHKCKTSERIALITDSTMAAGLRDGEYDLAGQKVILKNNEARLENGVLAGSTLAMSEAVKYMVKVAGVALEDAVTMASSVPAGVIGLGQRKGTIEAGKDADIVVLDKNLNVKTTIVAGKVVYSD